MTSSTQLLPRVEEAQISESKLRDYVLNLEHPQGSPKARVFAATLGIVRADWRYLREQLLAGVCSAPAVQRPPDEYGERYEVTLDVTGLNGRVARVRTGWIIRFEDPRPHLITAYVDVP